MADCRGSYTLRTACGRCERCKAEQEIHLRRYQASKAEESDTFDAPNSYLAEKLNKDLAKSEPEAAQDEPAQGLPIEGYRKTVPQWRLDQMNRNKMIEELVLREVDHLAQLAGRHVGTEDALDGASVQLARRHLEDAFYRLNRAVMTPARLTQSNEELLACLS